MIVKRICYVQDINSIVDYYESINFVLDSKTKISDTEVELIFSGYSSANIGVAAHFDSGAEAFLTFPDGTTSRLYVRRNNWLDE